MATRLRVQQGEKVSNVRLRYFLDHFCSSHLLKQAQEVVKILNLLSWALQTGEASPFLAEDINYRYGLPPQLRIAMSRRQIDSCGELRIFLSDVSWCVSQLHMSVWALPHRLYGCNFITCPTPLWFLAKMKAKWFRCGRAKLKAAQATWEVTPWLN